MAAIPTIDSYVLINGGVCWIQMQKKPTKDALTLSSLMVVLPFSWVCVPSFFLRYQDCRSA